MDLCEVESDLFIVNFRYGRRGANLQEGTKTVFPVSYEEAKREYEKLVVSKTKKGYQTSDAVQAATVQTNQAPAAADPSVKTEVIVKHLQDAVNGSYTGKWKLSRIIWRAGELGIEETAESIAQLIRSNDPFQTYSAIWALTKLKSNKGYETIYTLRKNLNKTDKIYRLATAYLLAVEGLSKQEVKLEIEQVISSLLLPLIRDNNEKKIEEGIREMIKNPGPTTAPLLVDLYLLSHDNPVLYNALFKVLETISLKLHYFRAVRHIYKLSEMMSDHLYYGLLSKRMCLSAPNYNVGSGYTYDYEARNYIRIAEDQKKEDTKLAFSDRTKRFFSRRILKVINKILSDHPQEYTTIATGILLAVSDDADQCKMSSERLITWNRETWTSSVQHIWYPKYETYPAYLSILYGGSDRFESFSGGTKWRYKDGQHEANELEIAREERSPDLWNQSPEMVIKLLAYGKVEEVLNFAIKVYKANPQFVNEVKEEDLFEMVASNYEAICDLSVEIVEERYKDKTPPPTLIAALLKSSSQKGVELGLNWLERFIEEWLGNTKSIVELILLGRSEVLTLVKDKLAGATIKLPAEQIEFEQIESLVRHSDQYSIEYFDALANLLSESELASLFSAVDPTLVKHLLLSEDIRNVKLGVALALANAAPVYELSKDVIDKFLASEIADLRAAGLSLLKEFPPEYLNENHQLIAEFCFSQYPEVREGVEPVAERLMLSNENFRKVLFIKLIDSLCAIEEYEGVHESNLKMLNNLFSDELRSMSKEQILELVLSKTDPAQKLGEEHFYAQSILTRLAHEEVIELAKSDVRTIRFEVAKYFETNEAKVRYELESSLKVFESSWVDIREKSFDFFLNKTEPRDWNIDLVLYAADNPKEDVQAFGRSLISKLFSSEEGEKLMLRLSEHPSKSMMLFTSNYLDIHAKGNPTAILELKQYFKNILFGINEGAVSKMRVFNFLHTESLKNEEVAKMTVALISEILMTQAKGDKSDCIDILLSIHEQYGDIEIPINVLPTRAYDNVV